MIEYRKRVKTPPIRPHSSAKTAKMKSLCATAGGKYPNLACKPSPRPLPEIPPVETAIKAWILFQLGPTP